MDAHSLRYVVVPVPLCILAPFATTLIAAVVVVIVVDHSFRSDIGNDHRFSSTFFA